MSDVINTKSDGPARKRSAPLWFAFVDAVIDADGDWVEMVFPASTSPATASNGVASHMGRKVTEIIVNGQTVYARMRTREDTE